MAKAGTINWRRRLLFGGIVLLFVVGVAFALRPKPIPVDFGTVAQGPLSVTIEEEGKTRVRDVYVVTAPLSGRLLRLSHEVGDAVIGGETVLAQIQPSEPTLLDARTQSEAEARVESARSALALAKAEVQRAMADRDFAISELNRADKLLISGVISKERHDRAQLLLDQAEAVLSTTRAGENVARANLASARANLITPGRVKSGRGDKECCVVDVVAPASGRVLTLFRESESVVSSGTPLLEIGDPTRLEVVVDLLSRDAVRIAPGAEVRFEDWGGEGVLLGQVRRIEPTGFTKVSALGVEEQRVKVVIDFTGLPETYAQLGHGYRVNAQIVEWQAEDVLKVPEAALFRQQGNWMVFVERAGDAALQPVIIGRNNGAEAQVLEGLAPGDRVVLYPGENVEEGVELVARGE